MSSNSRNLKDLQDSFVNVMFQEDHNGETVNKGNDSFYDMFVENGQIFTTFNMFMLLTKILASAQYPDPAIQGYA
jgi:hypothetical protein